MPFVWVQKQEKSFQTLKDKLTHVPTLVILNFSKTFELESVMALR